MSQQQCLPLPPKRRKRKNNDNATTNNTTAISFSDMMTDNMDAMTYLALVNKEASQLPDINVASSANKKNIAETSSMEEEVMEEKGASSSSSSSSSSFVPIDGSAAATQYLLSDRLDFIPPPTWKHLPCYNDYNSHDKSSITIQSSPTSEADTNHKHEEEDENRKRNSKVIEEWINNTISDFSSLRVYLDQCRASGLNYNSNNHGNMNVDVPMSKDRVGWHIFCLGLDEARGNIGGYFHDDDDDDDDEDSSENESMTENNDDTNTTTKKSSSSSSSSSNQNQTAKRNKWKKDSVPPTGYEPSSSLLCQFDQIIIRRVLSHHAYYISPLYCASSSSWEYFTKGRARWIYALLARLEKPLHRDEASMLRGLLRDLCRLRADIKFTTPNTTTPDDNDDLFQKKRNAVSLLNVLIVVVGIYFEQGGGSSNNGGCHGIMSIPSSSFNHYK